MIAVVLGGAALGQTTRNVPSQYATIQAAINASVSGDTVLVAPGTYPGAVNFQSKSISVVSSGGPLVTTIPGVANATAVTFQGGEGPATTFSGFKILGGGGGIFCQNASPHVVNCTIINQVKPINAGGAGIRCVSTGVAICSPTISGCTVANNLADYGAGISFEGNSTLTSGPTLTNCVISGNVAMGGGQGVLRGGGGAFFLGLSASVNVNRCTFRGNSSTVGGAAINTDNLATIVVSGSRIEKDGAGAPSFLLGRTARPPDSRERGKRVLI